MRAVMWDLPPEVAAWRRKRGAECRDEVWEGVLHMGPPPNVRHQRITAGLIAWLLRAWVPATGGMAVHEVAVAHPDWVPERWTENYRTPDVVLLLPERLGLDRNEYLAGGPDVVVEIRSPGDESYEKLPFYASTGVREVWVIHRDSKACEIFAAVEGTMMPVGADSDGWLSSDVAGVALRSRPEARFGIRLLADREAEDLLPWRKPRRRDGPRPDSRR